MNIKKFEIDWNDKPSLLRLYKQIKTQMKNIDCQNDKSSSVRKAEIFDAIRSIYEQDIKEHYSDLVLDNTPKYYVYAHTNPLYKICASRDCKTTFAATLGMIYFPFYIGKGIGNRCFDLNRNETHRKIKQVIERKNLQIEVVKIKENLTELEAFMLEDKLIDIFALDIYGGYLTNLDEGYNSRTRRLLYGDNYQKIADRYGKILFNTN